MAERRIVSQCMSNRIKIAVIGASYLQLPLVRRAKELGLEVHCFAWEEGAVCKDVADFFYPISIVVKDAILEICRKVGINGICTIASDIAATTVSYVAERMGLIANSYEVAVRANNKYLMRNALANAGLPNPSYRAVSSVEEALGIGWKYPLVVKPSDRSGSLGITGIKAQEELAPAIEKAISLSFSRQAMVEEFIEGREVSVEAISYQGVHYPLQITDKVTTGVPHFVELEHHQPSTLSKEYFTSLYDLTHSALDALGITDGASHSEYRISNDGNIVIVEIGGRMGGDFIGSDLVRLSTGYDFLKGVIDVALGRFKKPEITKNGHSAVYFLCKETEYLKPAIEKWKDNPAFVEGKILDEELRNVKCSADRSGYVIFYEK